MEDGEPTEGGRDAIALIAWAAKRVDAPIEIAGTQADAATVEALLAEEGVEVRVGGEGVRANRVSARWLAPDE